MYIRFMCIFKKWVIVRKILLFHAALFVSFFEFFSIIFCILSQNVKRLVTAASGLFEINSLRAQSKMFVPERN